MTSYVWMANNIPDGCHVSCVHMFLVASKIFWRNMTKLVWCLCVHMFWWQVRYSEGTWQNIFWCLCVHMVWWQVRYSEGTWQNIFWWLCVHMFWWQVRYSEGTWQNHASCLRLGASTWYGKLTKRVGWGLNVWRGTGL